MGLFSSFFYKLKSFFLIDITLFIDIYLSTAEGYFVYNVFPSWREAAYMANIKIIIVLVTAR